MTIELDTLVHAGKAATAALVQRSTSIATRHPTVVHAAKRPIAVLIRYQGETLAFEIDGTRVLLGEFDDRFPGRRADFERLATAQRQAI